MSDMAKKTRQFTWQVTNAGVLEGGGSQGNGSDGRSVERAQFGLSAEVPAAAVEITPVGVAGKGMSVSTNWLDCAVDTGLGERIMADLERWLR